MQLSIVFFAASISSEPLRGTANLASNIKRTLEGDWIESFANGRSKRAVDGRAGFDSLATMMAFMFGMSSGTDETELENYIQQIENEYTNYGCYCWIDGVDAGVIGGGKTIDTSDHHCKELYRCYKCVNIDYSKNYTDVSYKVALNEENGVRNLDCSVNSKQDAENICECDKRFAMNIAETKSNCDAGNMDSGAGSNCLSESFRTTTGGGNFNPRTQCDKKFHGHSKDNCCGIYPNRYPYDSNHRDCCRTTLSDEAGDPVEVFSLLNAGECFGDVVFSTSGDPHSYFIMPSN